MVHRLTDHYASAIAPLMVWLDSAKNGYRRLVIPLAEKHPLLRLAILAISAAHMPHDPDPDLDPTFSQSAGQAAIRMITERVRHMTHTESIWEDREAEAMLAAMLTLSNHSLLGSELSLAQSHRQAARILINTVTLKRAPDDELTVFLENQLASYDILACTTLFNLEHVQHATVPRPDRGDVLFGDFLNTLHRITIGSLQELAGGPHSATPRSRPSLSDLEQDFELARGSTLLTAGPMIGASSRSVRQDFVRLVQTYHYAGVLYACKRLNLSDGDSDEVEKHHAARLFQVLNQFEDINASLHNLAWPIFIAGICSCGDKQQEQKRMATVSDLCRMLSTSTGFEHYNNLFTFLQELWHSPGQDWSVLARQWERRGLPVIAV
ncbi:hypothetical protein A1O3_04329 [Capronia epimyces CBS 606.96]|uniref:C6 transcription factor n=1 Tax=Capronia epimyces CBS 606.96 TaxID=1182542 RepID=W9YCK2_9EURO|nr:uncharacterized protein A1O3_04329 [Capronia epimyces CBS 606.96]EXJ87370.1 hypothetical protein A1O3_04329 [Capronia epimyces CBS 606.96]